MGDHWIWNLYIRDNGYGQIYFWNQSYSAHLFSWMAYNKKLRPDPKHFIVRHKCREKSCVNPDHLELGTHKQNALDRKRDGTQWVPPTSNKILAM